MAFSANILVRSYHFKLSFIIALAMGIFQSIYPNSNVFSRSSWVRPRTPIAPNLARGLRYIHLVFCISQSGLGNLEPPRLGLCGARCKGQCECTSIIIAGCGVCGAILHCCFRWIHFGTSSPVVARGYLGSNCLLPPLGNASHVVCWHCLWRRWRPTNEVIVLPRHCRCGYLCTGVKSLAPTTNAAICVESHRILIPIAVESHSYWVAAPNCIHSDDLTQILGQIDDCIVIFPSYVSTW